MFRTVPYILMTFMIGADALGDYGKHRARFKFTDAQEGLNCQNVFDDVSHVKRVYKSVHVTGNTTRGELRGDNSDYVVDTTFDGFLMTTGLCYGYNDAFFNKSTPVLNDETLSSVYYTVEVSFDEYENNLDSRMDLMLFGLANRICLTANCGEQIYLSSWYGLTDAEIALIVILSTLGVVVIGAIVYAHCKRGDCSTPTSSAASTLPPPTTSPVVVPTETAEIEVV
ncbi:hypothetical protein EhV227 [Emiliania huxleyi virus 86]|uniref:Putative membrane protein n=2 Tax=Emiliania huxleyi virus 86 TaxID=181082 RepID=Q4A2Q5_EHV8U|nr:hypothetical protein EhV227 [Emiliania huxleyi virus 86]AHA54834.1 putative membrane protein [Emiliania huxleyi virus 145]AHA55856.1 putative membrane protein [Emiliania huxleyi virus 164]CAI65651.1 putative membrane protein [Emiliania huxleyi virus 86]